MTRFARRLLLVVLFSAMSIGARAQPATLAGRVVERSHGRPLAGATVQLKLPGASEALRGEASDTAGRFLFAGLTDSVYILDIAFVGYASSSRRIAMTQRYLDLGDIPLADSAVQLKEAVVEGRLIGTEQIGDTTEYSADAFATEPDATAEDLVEKLPGVDVEDDGSVTSEGEEIQQVLVDGQPYIGSDAAVTLRNLPADLIDKVQVFDKSSDQAELTGFDDGQSVRTMNIITRSDRTDRLFGKSTAGYATDSRYTASTALNSFSGDRRLSLLALSNNVDQQNFSQQDLLGVMNGGGGRTAGGSGGMFGRGARGGGRAESSGPLGFGEGGSNFLIGQIPGRTSSHSIGLSYVDSLGGKAQADAGYFFNLTDNTNTQDLARTYGFLADTAALYAQHGEMAQKNYNHRFNLRLDYAPDSSNELLFTPHLYLQDNHASSALTTSMLSGTDPFPALGLTTHHTDTRGSSLRGHLVYRRKFGIPGRTISLDAAAGANRRESTRTNVASVAYPPGSLGRPDSLNHEYNVVSNGWSLSANLVYTEPFGESNLAELTYAPSRSRGNTDDRAFDFDPAAGTYSLFNPRFSNVHDTRYTTQRAGAGWRFHSGVVSSLVGVAYQIAELMGEQTRNILIDRTYYNVLPSALLSFDFSGRRYLRIQYRSATAAPTVMQLQDLVNKTNLLIVSAGNPDLRPSLMQSVTARLSLADIASGRTFFASLSLEQTADYIGNHSFIATHDTIIRRGIRLSKWAQFTEPVNLDGYRSARGSAAFGFPIDAIGGMLSFKAGMSATALPSVIRNAENRTDRFSVNPGIVLSSTSRGSVDYMASYTAGFTRVRNTTFPDLDHRYFSHRGSARFRWTFLDGFVFRSELSTVFTSAPADTFDRALTLLNVHLGHKLFANRRGEIYVLAHNILDEQSSVVHTVSDDYFEETETTLLGRYILLAFTYTLR